MVKQTPDIPEPLPLNVMFGPMLAPVSTAWWDFVERVVGDATQLEVAHKAGIDKSHVSAWKARGVLPTAPFAIKFARSYGRNVLEALVAAEIITPEEAELHEVRVGIRDYTLEQLAEETWERVRSRSGDDDS